MKKIKEVRTFYPVSKVMSIFLLAAVMVLTLDISSGLAQEKESEYYEFTPISSDPNAPTVIEALPLTEELGGEVTISADPKDGSLTAKFTGGSVIILQGEICVFCAEIIKIAPNLTVPIGNEKILTTSEGATIKRLSGQNKNVIIVEGKALYGKRKK